MASKIISKAGARVLSITNFMKVRQGEGLGEFFVCVVNPRDLISATYEFPREYDPEKDDYVGIQRKIKEEKLREIREYVQNDKEACFPNAIIANLDTSFLLQESKDELLIDLGHKNEIGEIEKGIFIIDGQHRLFAFKENLPSDFELIVVIFKGLEIASQAYLFSTVNDKQQRLNSSQVQDLNEIMHIETPEKVVHRFTRMFNSNDKSPWKDKINILGSKITKKDGEVVYGTMSQYSFAKEIIKMIYPSTKYFKIRNLIKKLGDRSKLLKVDELASYDRNYPFWNYYVNRQDELMGKILLNYFRAISTVFDKDWRDTKKIVTKTTGYIAFMRLLKKICLDEGDKISDYDFNLLMQSIKDSPDREEFVNENYPAGAKGQKKMYDFILKIYEENKIKN